MGEAGRQWVGWAGGHIDWIGGVGMDTVEVCRCRGGVCLCVGSACVSARSSGRGGMSGDFSDKDGRKDVVRVIL